ncbi:hypothetical protein HW555_011313, partial [Spodoptera exigua]
MASLQCINCNVRMSRIRRHALLDENEELINTIRIWIYPRDITPADYVCHACWQLASHAHSSNDISRRRVGYQHLRSEDEACVPCWLRARRARIAPPVDDLQTPSPDQVDVELSILMCAVCGQSLTTTTSDGEWNTDNIARLLEHQQMSAMNEVCGVCWDHARDLNVPFPEERQERPQRIVLPNIRRAAETPQHCVFQECTEPQRNAVPEETRREVLIRFQYYIPRGAHICSMHRQEANYENLYTAEYSLNTFTSVHIEEIIFILMEGLQNISYENIQNYPDHQVQYFVGVTKAQHQQILDRTPRLRNMCRGSFALTALLCKLRTGDSGDRLSCLFQVPRRTLETLMSVARDILLTDYVPQYLGFSHIRREQLSTLDANRSRCVTINRWVVEAVNGRFKRDFKIFRHEYFNRGCRHLMADFKIAAALLNAFTPPFAENIHAEQFVSIIYERLFLSNTVAALVMKHNLNRRGSWFVPIDATTVSFPRLSIEELILFACGVYQIRQARSYVGEHFRFHGIYTLEVARDRVDGLEGINPMLLRAKIKSRHSSARTY